MNRDEFDTLVQKLESVSCRNPGLYRARLIGLVTLAYAYLGLILLGSLVLCLLMISMVIHMPAAIKLALVGLVAFGGFFLAVLRGLWVWLPAPKGEPVHREDAPQLFELLDELAADLDCPPFHHVLITGDVNASVVQVPRLGIFGWHANYLVLGLPLMQILAPEEFKAVLAHEFTHSSSGHGRFGNWIYRVRRTWDQVFQQMAARRNSLGFAVFRFVQWFWPVFNAHAFVLARINEYEADARAVELAGADAMARALIRIRVEGALLAEKFWPDVFRRANQEPEPPADVVFALNAALKAGPPADAVRWLRQAFSMETNNADTHPSLKDRLRAIGRLPAGVESGSLPETIPPPAQNAAEFYLGEFAVDVARKMSEDWQESVYEQWTTRHEKACALAQELAELEAFEAAPTLAQIWEKARCQAELLGDAAAIETLTQVVALDPKHAGASFILGRYYLQNDDPRGVKFIETAIGADPVLSQNGCNLLYAYYNRTGQREKLRPVENRFDEFQKTHLLAQKERSDVSEADTFAEHELTKEQIAELRRIFSAEPEIGSVAVARKVVQHFPDNPCYTISLKIETAWWKNGRPVNPHLVQRLLDQIHLPGRLIIFVSEKNLRNLGSKVFAVPGAVIYARAD